MPVPLPTKVFESRSFLLRATAGIDRKALCWDRFGFSPAHLYEAGEKLRGHGCRIRKDLEGWRRQNSYPITHPRTYFWYLKLNLLQRYLLCNQGDGGGDLVRDQGGRWFESTRPDQSHPLHEYHIHAEAAMLANSRTLLSRP